MSDASKIARESLELMANACSVDMVIWNIHSNAVLDLAAENAQLKAALEPSDETKKAYMSEFSVPVPFCEDDGNGGTHDMIRNINVPWTTIKDIMKAILEYANTGDKCQMPDCDRLGVPGNENVIDGVVVCDYCVVKSHIKD